MRDNIPATYKKSKEQSEHKINLKAKSITENLHLADRINVLDGKPAYITLKDHKANFRSHPICRLINPCKSEIGLISKQILDRINSELIKTTKLNQWKNSSDVIKWFTDKETPRSSRLTLLTFTHQSTGTSCKRLFSSLSAIQTSQSPRLTSSLLLRIHSFLTIIRPGKKRMLKTCLMLLWAHMMVLSLVS